MGRSQGVSDNTDLFSGGQGSSSLTVLTRFLLTTLRQFWALCTTALLILVLLYWMYGSVVTLVLLLVSVIGFLYNAQDLLLFYPDQPPHARLYVESPSAFGLPFDNIQVKTKDGVRIHMMLIKQPQERLSTAPTFIFFHGNAGNIGHRLLNAHALYSYSGANILLVEYRGYGKSAGRPTESGLYSDASAALDYITTRPDVDQSNLVVYGRSLGGAIAIQVCSVPRYARCVRCLVLENTFTALPDLARQLFDLKLIRYLPILFHKNKFPSRELIKKIKIPTLFLSGLMDNLVPPKMMKELFDVSGSMLKRMALFEDGNHNETWQCAGYYEAINRFLEEAEELKSTDGSVNSAATYMVDVPFDDGGSQPFDL